MNKEAIRQELMILRKKVEEKSSLRVRTSRDFENLAETITESGAGYISASTLKRIWGYVEDNGGKHTATLDVLARYAGYPRGFGEFKKKIETQYQTDSGYVSKRVLDILTLEPGKMVEVEWLPNRKITLRKEEECIMEVTESRNAKLEVGMRVKCPRIVEGDTLLLDIIKSTHKKPLLYEAGKTHGVVWRVLE